MIDCISVTVYIITITIIPCLNCARGVEGNKSTTSSFQQNVRMTANIQNQNTTTSISAIICNDFVTMDLIFILFILHTPLYNYTIFFLKSQISEHHKCGHIDYH